MYEFLFLYNLIFVNYSFVYPENDNDTLTLTFGISKNDPLHLRKLQLLEKLEIFWAFDFKYQISNQEIPLTPGLLGFSRVFVMDKGKFNPFNFFLNLNLYF